MKKLIFTFFTVLSLFGNMNMAIALDRPGGADVHGSTIGIVHDTDFASLNGAINYVNNSNATLEITQSMIVNSSVTVPANLALSFKQGGSLIYSITASGNITATINGAIDAGDYQIFGGGNLAVVINVANNSIIKNSWGTFTTTGTQASGSTGLTAGSSGLTVGTSTVVSGTTGRLLYDNAGLLGEYTIPLSVTTGGTGQTTANNAFNALAPSQTSNSGKFLTTNGTSTSWDTPTAGANTTLSNLGSTALNASLDPATSDIYSLGVGHYWKNILGDLFQVHNAGDGGTTSIYRDAGAGATDLVLPSGNGSSGQTLITNGSGNLSWASAPTTTNLLISNTAPTISSGFGTGASVTANNGTAAFRINVGTSGIGTSGVIGLPAATTGWNCFTQDMTTISASVLESRQTGSTTTSATITQYSSVGVATAWTANDILAVSCFAY